MRSNFFIDPAFVPTNFSTCPFEDQTTQMLTLRGDVKSTLNDHRLFKEIHQRILNGERRINVCIIYMDHTYPDNPEVVNV